MQLSEEEEDMVGILYIYFYPILKITTTRKQIG